MVGHACSINFLCQTHCSAAQQDVFQIKDNICNEKSPFLTGAQCLLVRNEGMNPPLQVAPDQILHRILVLSASFGTFGGFYFSSCEIRLPLWFENPDEMVEFKASDKRNTSEHVGTCLAGSSISTRDRLCILFFRKQLPLPSWHFFLDSTRTAGVLT